MPHVVKYALSYLFAQAEFGLLCPVSLTDSTARMLRRFASDELQARYLPRLTSTAWPDLAGPDRELDARPVADTLYHALAGALLLAEGEQLWRERRSARKLLAAALYLRK